MNIAFGILLIIISVASTGFFYWVSKAIHDDSEFKIYEAGLQSIAILCAVGTGSVTFMWFLLHVW